MAEPERSNSSIGSEPDRSGLLERFSAGHGLRTSRSRRQSRQMKREQGVELDEWGMSSTDQVRSDPPSPPSVDLRQASAYKVPSAARKLHVFDILTSFGAPSFTSVHCTVTIKGATQLDDD